MSKTDFVSVYGSQSFDYHRAFEVFLAHTDQKAKAHSWLKNLVHGLPSRKVFIDAGAGNGKVTEWFVPDFQRTIAIEPNPSLCDELRHTCPVAEVLPQTIAQSHPTVLADLVLCSHVLYYIEAADRVGHLEKLASWLAPRGVLAVVVQNHDTDCMRMIEYFHGQRFHLSEVASGSEALRGRDYLVEIATDPAEVVTPDFDSAYIVAEFMLNILPMVSPPPRHALEEYVHKYFAAPGGGFHFTCDQDFLTVRRRPEISRPPQA
jgi:hypothetical protein